MTRKATKLPASGPHAYAFLSSWREITGLTQAAVAAYFGVSDVTIHRWETGKAPITVENFVLLAKLFHAETPGHLLFPPHAAKRAAALREANVIADRMSAMICAAGWILAFRLHTRRPIKPPAKRQTN